MRAKAAIWFVQTSFSYAECKINQRQDEPSALELIMIILNYVTCMPVLILVGCFRYESNFLTCNDLTQLILACITSTL